jgi:23S rRNA-/tRNA-specific pseudouridylate synthase
VLHVDTFTAEWYSPHVDNFAHNKSGIASRDSNRRSETVVTHKREPHHCVRGGWVEGFVSSGCFQQKQQDRLPGLDVAWEDEHMAVVVKPQGPPGVAGWVRCQVGGWRALSQRQVTTSTAAAAAEPLWVDVAWEG